MSKSLNTNFHVKAPKPIDSRMAVSAYVDLDAIPIKYNHMITHVETTDTDWKYYSATNTWVEVTYNSPTTWGDIIGSIGDQADLMNEFNKYSLTTHTHPQLPPLSHTHVEVDITDLDKYTQEEVDTFLKYKSQVVTGDIVQGLISINAGDSSTFDIAAGIGVKTVWAPTSPTTPPVSYQVDYPEMLGISLTNLLTNTATYVGILYDELLDTFSVVQSTTPFSLDARRDVIMKAVIEHPDNAVISKIHNIGNPARLSGQNTQDISLSVGPLNISGNKYSPQGNNLGLNRTTGSIFGVGISFNTPTSPNTRIFSGNTGVSFQHRLQTGEEYGSTTSLEPQYYDNAGVRTVIPINKWSIPRVFLLPDGTTTVQYAQVYYDTFNEALSAIDTEDFIVESRLQNAILRSCIIVSSSATNLSDSAEALFVEIDKWGWTKKPGVIGTAGGTTDYISSIALVGTSLDFTGVGSAFTGPIDLAGILGSTDYVSNVVLTGTDLIFTGVGSAYSSTVDFSTFGLLAGGNDWTGPNTWERSSGISGLFTTTGPTGTSLALGVQAQDSADALLITHTGAGRSIRVNALGSGTIFEGSNSGGSVITIDNNGDITAPSIDIGGSGTNVMLDNGTVTPLSGLGGGSTDYISAVSLNAGFDTLTFTGIGSAYNSTVDMSEYVTKTNYQLITGQKEFTIAGNFNALVSRASGTAPAFSSSGSGTGGAIYGKTSGTGSAIIGAVDAGSSAFAFQGGVLTNNPTFTVDKSGNIVANSIDIGGAGTEVLLDDGTTTPLKPYVSYVALVSQTGTSNPTAIVLENNLGGTVTFVRGAVGLYTANLTGAFTLDKVAIFLTNSADNIMSGNYFSTNAVGIQTSDRNGNLADNLFNKTSVEIRVYS